MQAERGSCSPLFVIFALLRGRLGVSSEGEVVALNEEFSIEERAGFSFLRELYDWVEAAVMAVFFMVLIFTFVVRMVSVNGISMNPTLEDGERLIVSRVFYTPRYGDIVVITKPNSQHEPLIKRVIATEGQEIDIDFEKGIVTVDGKILDEPYIAEPTNAYYRGVAFPQTVPEGCVFVMGDNRNNSWDSRAPGVGMVDARHILGKVYYRVMPYSRLGVPQ